MPRDSEGHLAAGTLSPRRDVPLSIARPEYVGRPAPARYTGPDAVDAETVGRIRRAGRIAAQALDEVAAAIRPGISTDELDRVGHDFLLAHDAYPSTLGYRGFPKSLCTSINEVICHGIPDDTTLLDGDIVNVDITAFMGDVHGDLNATFAVGEISDQAQHLVDTTRRALARGIAAVAPGRQVNVIGRAIESYARRFGYGVVRDYTGHGVGEAFHSGLIIPHYDAAPAHDRIMVPGMVFTIEPMLTLGEVGWDLWPDGWTVVTRDLGITAQFEHTIVVTETGSEILTLP